MVRKWCSSMLLHFIFVLYNIGLFSMYSAFHIPRRRLCQRFSSILQRSNSQSAKPAFKKEFDNKYFNHNEMEKSIYRWWESSGYFAPTESRIKATKDDKPFVVSMPPPNVTGNLHMGHAIFVALQDIMIRFQRMRGKATLWLPGT